MGGKLKILAALAASACAIAVQAQQPSTRGQAPAGRGARPAEPMGPVKGDGFHTTFVRLGTQSIDALLYEPDAASPNTRIGLVYAYPSPNFEFSPAPEMAKRGYRVLLVRHYGEDLAPFVGVNEISRGITYLRTVPGVQRVVIVGHSGGGRLIPIYENLAEHGPATCQGPHVLIPCTNQEATGLAKPDGMVVLDPALGAVNTASSFDPAFDERGERAIESLDMYSPANGYDPKTGSAHYSADFVKRFYMSQSARNNRYIDYALGRLKLIEAGKGKFKDDEPLVIPGAVTGGDAARLYHTDLSLQERTKVPHILLKADGTTPIVIVQSVRPPAGLRSSENVGTMAKGGAMNVTVRTFLANFAIRTDDKTYAYTADDITGVEWDTSNKSGPLAAEGVTVPALVETMTCNNLMTGAEVLYDHLASKDKTYVAVEGALHMFTPCKPEYGDTMKRTFDYLDSWLAKPGRF